MLTPSTWCAFVLAHKCATRTKLRQRSKAFGPGAPFGHTSVQAPVCRLLRNRLLTPSCCAPVCAALVAWWLRHRVLTHECWPRRPTGELQARRMQVPKGPGFIQETGVPKGRTMAGFGSALGPENPIVLTVAANAPRTSAGCWPPCSGRVLAHPTIPRTLASVRPGPRSPYGRPCAARN